MIPSGLKHFSIKKSDFDYIVDYLKTNNKRIIIKIHNSLTEEKIHYCYLNEKRFNIDVDLGVNIISYLKLEDVKNQEEYILYKSLCHKYKFIIDEEHMKELYPFSNI